MINARTAMAGRCSMKLVLLAGCASASLAASAFAQDAEAPSGDDQYNNEAVITGIRAPLRNALDQERQSDNLTEVIEAVDIGKLPDQNLAEVLENVTGIEITLTALSAPASRSAVPMPTVPRSTASRFSTI